MEIYIIGKGVKIDTALDAYIRRRINFALGRLSTRVERVNVTLTDENGPKGGLDKTCRIRVRLSRLPTLVVEQVDTDLHAAIDFSAGRVGRTVARKLDRAITAMRDKRTGKPTREEP